VKPEALAAADVLPGMATCHGAALKEKTEAFMQRRLVFPCFFDKGYLHPWGDQS